MASSKFIIVLTAIVVSGTAATLLAKNPGWTPDQVKGAIMQTAAAPAGYGFTGDANLLAQFGKGNGRNFSIWEGNPMGMSDESIPIYGSPLTLGLARNRIEEAGLLPTGEGKRLREDLYRRRYTQAETDAGVAGGWVGFVADQEDPLEDDPAHPIWREDWGALAAEVVQVAKLMDGLNRFRFAKDPESLAVSASARNVVSAMSAVRAPRASVAPPKTSVRRMATPSSNCP